MAIFFVVVGAWLIGRGSLLASLLLRAPLFPTDSSNASLARDRHHAFTLLDTMEISL